MSRDPHKLKAFVLADELVVEVYDATRNFPIEERYGLQSQIRRAAVSVAANLVEGNARSTARDYAHFIVVAIGSASEARYLIDLAARLGFLDRSSSARLVGRYGDVIRPLHALSSSLQASSADHP